MTEVFVDAGAWIAVTDLSDQYHQAASATYQRLLREPIALVTTNLVVAEAYVAVRRASGFQPASRFLQAVRQSGRLRKVYSNAAVEEQAELLLRQYADQDFSFTDAVSFAVMRQRRITEAFAFDHHFLTAGFQLLA